MNLSDITTLNIKHFHCIITGISKTEAIKLLQKVEHKTKHQEPFRSCKFTSNSNLNKKKWKIIN